MVEAQGFWSNQGIRKGKCMYNKKLNPPRDTGILAYTALVRLTKTNCISGLFLYKNSGQA